MYLMVNEEVLEALELHAAHPRFSPCRFRYVLDFLERAVPESLDLLVVQPGEIISGFPGDAKLALFYDNRGNRSEGLFLFRRRKLELFERLGELFRRLFHD